MGFSASLLAQIKVTIAKTAIKLRLAKATGEPAWNSRSRSPRKRFRTEKSAFLKSIRRSQSGLPTRVI